MVSQSDANVVLHWVKLPDSMPHLKNNPMLYPLVKYNQPGKRLLVVTEELSPFDRKDSHYLASNQAEIFGKALDFAAADSGVAIKSMLAVPFEIISFKQFKGMSERQQAELRIAQRRRIEKIASKYQPDCIVFAGLRLSQNWINEDNIQEIVPIASKFPIEHVRYLRGRVLHLDMGGKVYPTVSTFSLDHVASLNPAYFRSTINLIGFFARDIATALLEKNRYTLPPLDAQTATKLITSLRQWKKFYKLLVRADYPSIDTETDNLNRRYDNRMLTMQITLDGKLAYVMPWHHPESPFKGSELESVRRDLVKYFERGKSKCITFHHGKFDLLQIRRELRVQFFNHRIWDTEAGEYFLDENRKFFSNAGLKRTPDKEYGPFSLAGLALVYGGFAYLEGDVSKKDRANLANLPLVKVAEYGGKDVIYPWHIRRFQISEAKRRGEAYKGYTRAVAELGSDMIHVFTDMEFNGSLIDKSYLQSLMLPRGALAERRAQVLAQFKASPVVIALNEKLAREAGHVARNGLYGKTITPWVFKINNQEHQQRLFFDELQLNVLGTRKDGSGKIDKNFVEEYRERVKEVAWLDDYRKLDKLVGTYVKGIYKHLIHNPDMQDDHLRSNYSFVQILTTRSGSSDINLQNIPSHGPDAKIIKREFIAPPDCILIKIDYNAHEVRGWGNISGDKKIAAAFAGGIRLRRELRKWVGRNRVAAVELGEWLNEVGWFDEIKDEKGRKASRYTREERIALALRQANRSYSDALQIILELEIEGDTHRKNYYFFFGVPPDQVTDEQRQSVKQVVFGTIYGKGPESLSREIWKKEWKLLDRSYKSKWDDTDPDEDDEYREWLEQYHKLVNRGKALIDKLFETMEEGGQWIRDTQREGKESCQALSPFGAVRHLWGYWHSERRVNGMMNRRGPNSIVQGLSSNIIFSACRQMQILVQKCRRFGHNLGYKHTNVVHDSNESVSKLVTLPMTLYYLEHSLTTLVSRKMRDTYGWDVPIGLEIEFELGGSLAHMSKWDYSEARLLEIVANEIDWMKTELHYKMNKTAILKAIKHNWRIVNEFRLRELDKQGNSIKPSYRMELTPDKLADADLIWALPAANVEKKLKRAA